MSYNKSFRTILQQIPTAWVVLVIALVVTFWSWSLVKDLSRQRIKNTIFDYRVEHIEDAITDQMLVYQQMLRGGIGLFATSVKVEHSEWHNYVANLHLDEYYPGIQGVGFGKYILSQDKETHIAKIRAEGDFFQSYALKPEGEREEYVSVVYLEPMNERNQRAIGFDMFSEPTHRAAMERARDTGKPALSGKVTLVQEMDNDIQAGYLLYLPVYRYGTIPNTVTERRIALVGYVYSPFRMDDLIHGIFGKQPSKIDFEIYDGDNIRDLDRNNLMYDEVVEHPIGSGRSNRPSQFKTMKRLEIAGHTWTIYFSTLPQFEIETKTYVTDIILLGGVAMSFLLFGVTRLFETSQLLAIQREHNLRLQKEISERRRVESALRASEERFYLAVRGSNDGLWDWNLKTDAMYQSPRFEQMLGFEGDELHSILGVGPDLIRHPFGAGFDCIHPDDAERVLAHLTAYLEREIPAFECTFRVQHKNGYYLWIMSRAMAVWDEQGRPERMVGTHTDLTTFNLTEEALRRSEEKYRHIVETSQEGIWIIDEQAKTTYVNTRMAQMLDYPEAELLGRSVFNFMDEATRQEATRFFEYTQQVTGEVHDLRFQRKDGSDMWAIVSTTPMIDKEKFFLGNLAMVTDITERKRIEEELKQAKQTAETANYSKSVFLANMSHELRTPLNGILGYAQILVYQDNSLTEDQRQSINIIEQSGEYLLALINDILDLARVESGKIELSPTIVSLRGFLLEITRLFELRAEQKGIIFSYQPLSTLPIAIKVDETRLRQVIINLLGNAFKFTQQGRVVLKVIYDQEELNIHVEDSGCGIAPDDLGKIFAPFQQVGYEEYRKQGTGLGLSITKGLVETMGGTLRVTSVLGQGSTFSLSFKLPEILPNAPQLRDESQSSNKVIGYQGKHRTVLVVDDNWANRSVLIKMLAHLGFTVIEAENGQEGLNKVHESPPFDLILVDLVMPGLNGFAVIEQLKVDSRCQKTVLIAVSASAFDLDRQQSLQLGCHAFIAKPIKLEVLLESLRVHLNLTWIYEQDATATTNNNTLPLPLELSTTKLTHSQINDLLELTKQGDIMGICDFAEKLEKADEELATVARHIHELAVQFKTNEIRQFAQKFLVRA